MIQIVIYSRHECHLCEEMKQIVTRVSASFPSVVEEIDISTDQRLDRLYGLEIPVLMVDGKKVAKYRVTEGELRRILAGKAGGAGKAGEEM
jgi:hypothetical protein